MIRPTPGAGSLEVFDSGMRASGLEQESPRPGAAVNGLSVATNLGLHSGREAVYVPG